MTRLFVSPGRDAQPTTLNFPAYVLSSNPLHFSLVDTLLLVFLFCVLLRMNSRWRVFLRDTASPLLYNFAICRSGRLAARRLRRPRLLHHCL
jgi:hypothetical protein